MEDVPLFLLDELLKGRVLPVVHHCEPGSRDAGTRGKAEAGCVRASRVDSVDGLSERNFVDTQRNTYVNERN